LAHTVCQIYHGKQRAKYGYGIWHALRAKSDMVPLQADYEAYRQKRRKILPYRGFRKQLVCPNHGQKHFHPNYILKCFVLIELKTNKITHQDIGQLDMYVRMFDDIKKREGDNPTIGILLCTENDKTIARYSVLNENEQLFAAKYMSYLPTELAIYCYCRIINI